MSWENGLLHVQSVAAAGSTIDDATAITFPSPAFIIGTAADGTKGIKLPGAVKGKMIIIKNHDSENAVLKVWPANGSTAINAVAAGSSLDMAAKKSAIFVATSSTQWYTVSLLPS